MRLLTTLLVLLLLTGGPALAQSTRVLAFGDSITTGLFDDGVECPEDTSGGYPPHLQSLLAQNGLAAVVSNHGYCGELTIEGVSRIDQVLALGGDVLILMEGTNDISDPDISVETMRANLATMAEKVIAAGVEPVVSTVIPRGPETGGQGRNNLFAEQLIEDAEENDWILADPFHDLVDRPFLFETYYGDPLHPNPQGYALLAQSFVAPTRAAASRNSCELGVCVPGDTALCLNDGRFRVTVEWETPQGREGVGKAEQLTADTGYFWFFDRDNVEIVIKVLSACGSQSNKYWVFAAGLTNVRADIRVTDTERCLTKTYKNQLGVAFQPIQDTSAFDTCP